MKLKAKTRRRIQGSITVLMVIIMLPMMTMSAIIVDASRTNMARSMVSSAGDLAMNTALANYDTIVKDVYGLFAMSQGQSDEELAKSLKDYFSKTLVSYGVVNTAEADEYVDYLMGDFKALIAGTKDKKASNFIDMSVNEFTVKKIANPEILRSQIVDYMKYRAPVNFGMSFLDSVKAFKNVETQTEVTKAQVEAQQSTQDVNQACATAMKLIREHDKLIDSINTDSGAEAVKGKVSKSDGNLVKIKEYDEQVGKYNSSWSGDNYQKANQLAMIFLLNSPKVDSLYLSKLDAGHSQFFIKNGGNGLIYDKSGISISVSTASDYNGAKKQLTDQIAKLNNASGKEKKTANSYVNAKFLDYKNISGTKNENYKIANETNAINTFIEYEKFLTDTGTLKYSDVKSTLESIYTLGKYYDNYNTLAGKAVSSAKKEMDTANGKVSSAKSNATKYYNNIKSYVDGINDANKNYNTSYDFLNGINNGDNEDLHTVVSNMLSQKVSMPTATKTVSGYDFKNFNNFVNNNYKENSSDTDDKYIKVTKEIIGSSLKTNVKYAAVCNAADSYFKEIANNTTSKTFDTYMKDKVGSSVVDNDLYKLLLSLRRHSITVDDIKDAIDSYNGIVNGYKALVDDAHTKKNAYDAKKNEQASDTANYKACLNNYFDFGNRYQNDIGFYKKYIAAAKNTITEKVSAVSTQFAKIEDNVSKIAEQLTAIDKQLGVARTAIETYNKNLNTWSTKNNEYKNKAGNDNFSEQNKADIEAAHKQYDTKKLGQFRGQLLASWLNEYNEFKSILTRSDNFKYGKTKIKDIKTADKLLAAIPSDVKNSLGKVVTVEDANSKLNTLYKGEKPGKIEIDNDHKFLSPTILPLKFLIYLNATYKDESTRTADEIKDDTTIKNSYETSKSKLKSDNNGSSAENAGKTADEIAKETADKALPNKSQKDKYGYSYKGKTAPEDLPSKGEDKNTGNNNTQYKLDEKDGKIDASSGFTQQSNTLGQILNGIGNIAENALENVYILTYIFENFSYNTLIQDELINGEGISKKSENKTGINMLSNATKALNDSTIREKYVDNQKMLSSYPMKAANNYFYGAEIEYILYGNESAEKNVTYAKASIYAIRFAFNCIYAFTNSDIRNATRNVGLAVQAATCGFVPYQIVQVILQLALAAGESAFDLSMMNAGLKVAVVKSKDTWSLSLKNAFETAAEKVADVATDVIKKGAKKISDGIQGIVDATADNITTSVEELNENLTSATKSKMEEIVNTASNYVQSIIEEKLNDLQFLDDGKDINTEVGKAFDEISGSLHNELQSRFGGNKVADSILSVVEKELNGVINNTKSTIQEKISNPDPKKAYSTFVTELNNFKKDLITKMKAAVDKIGDGISKKVTELTEDVQKKINGYVGDKTKELTDKATDELKKKIIETTNDFSKNFLETGENAIGGGVDNLKGNSSSSLASAIKFGYKDYLMLFTFISISVNDKPILNRTADVIQMNITNAKTSNGATYQHMLTKDDGSQFKMSQAKTYVAVHASVDVDMLFMNMDFFTNILSDAENGVTTEVDGDFTPAAKLQYNGLSGY
mgnify:CR=1 FL=1